jgi:hypothetical protein
MRPGARAEINVPDLEPGRMYQGLRVHGDFHIHPSPRPRDEFGVYHSRPSNGDLDMTRKMRLPGNSYIIDNAAVVSMRFTGIYVKVNVIGTRDEILGR